MNRTKIFEIRFIRLVLATAFLTTAGIAKGENQIDVILDQSYSLAPNVVRQTELWKTPKGRMLLVTEYYCPEHSNYGGLRYLFIRPPAQDWSELEKFPPNSSMAQVRDSACELLSEGEFELKSAVDYSDLGYRLREHNRLGEAIDVFRKAIEIYPHEAYLYHNLGNVLRADLQLKEAILVYRQGIELTSDSTFLSALYTGLGNALDDSGRFEEAITAFRRAIAIKSDNALPHFDLAVALYRQGQFEEAIQECRSAIQLDSNFIAPQELLAEIQRQQSSR